MEKLKQIIHNTCSCLSGITEKLASLQLLSEQELSDVSAAVNSLRIEQARCVMEVTARTGCTPEDCTDLEAMAHLVAAHERQRQAQLRGLVNDILEIRGLDGYAAALEPVHQKLEGLTDPELLAMDEAGDLQPYRLLLELTTRPDLAFGDVEPIAAHFGVPLAFGLLGGKFTSTAPAEDEHSGPPSAPPVVEVPACPAVPEAPEVLPAPGPEILPLPPEPEENPADVPDIPLSGVTEMAAALLQQPDILECGAHLQALLIQMAAEGQLMEALVLSRTLAGVIDDAWFGQTFRNLLHGTNLPLENRDYSAYLIQDDPQTDPLEQYSRLSAAFWAGCFPKQGYDHILYININTMVESQLDQWLPDTLTDVRQALSLITGDLKELSFSRGDGAGLSAAVLDALASGPVLEQKRRNLIAAAREKQNAPRSSICITGLETLMKNIMGPAGDLGPSMKIIAEDRTVEYARVQGIFGRFVKGDGQIRMDLLDNYIDAQWDALRRDDKSIMLRRLDNDSPARNSLRREIIRRLEIMDEWLQRNARSAGGFEKFDLNGYRSLIDQLTNTLNSACTAIGTLLPREQVEHAAGLRILRQTLAHILEIIRGERNLLRDSAEVFAPLLTAEHMLLDASGDPILDELLNDVPGMEPWRMMLRHIAGPHSSLTEALDQIENFELASGRYEDYGSASILRTVLGLPQMDHSQEEGYALSDCQEQEDVFRGEVRLACAYGQIAEETKETVFTQLVRCRPLFIPESDVALADRCCGNYAHFRMLLECLNRQVAQAKIQRRKHFLREYEKRTMHFQRDALPPMLIRVRQEIENQNYATAEEFLIRFDAGELELPQEIGYTAEFNFHAQFLSCADWYCQQCEQVEHKSRSPRDWGGRVVQSRNFWSGGNERTQAEKLLEAWPASKGDPGNSRSILQFLNLLGIQAVRIQNHPGCPAASQYEVFSAEVQPVAPGLEDYAHPVAKYGTLQASPLHIVCLYGCKGSATLIDIMTKRLQLGGNTIVLMDGVLTMLERRRVAAQFKTMTSGQNAFLLIDRVLLLYLAALDSGNRLKAMLHCTLPYTYEQLYTEGAGAVADEMFMGRIADRKSLCDPNGACLVYGGRQLGKTALLRRVESINNKPADRQYAVYLDIKDQGCVELIRQLKKKLLAVPVNGAPLLTGNEEDLEQICDSLRDSADRYQQLTILIDEVDAYFEEIAARDYNDLHPVTILQEDFKGKIKFVFAGTHNVAATDKGMSNNTDIVKLRQPLCIKPLSPADAIQLIRLPLSYLGFDIGQQQIALILANTNSYPGLIHLFCNALVKSICDNYGKYYDADTGNPPYTVSDEQLKAIFREKDMKREIEHRVIATIKLNKKYSLVANLLAFLEYRDQDNGYPRLYGYTPAEIQKCNVQEIGHPDFMPDRISISELDVLMEEMVKMGILWKNPRTGSYRFRQQDFLSYIGTDEQVMNTLLGGVQ